MVADSCAHGARQLRGERGIGFARPHRRLRGCGEHSTVPTRLRSPGGRKSGSAALPTAGRQQCPGHRVLGLQQRPRGETTPSPAVDHDVAAFSHPQQHRIDRGGHHGKAICVSDCHPVPGQSNTKGGVGSAGTSGLKVALRSYLGVLPARFAVQVGPTRETMCGCARRCGVSRRRRSTSGCPRWRRRAGTGVSRDQVSEVLGSDAALRDRVLWHMLYESTVPR